MKTFDFPFHTINIAYPSNSNKISFGGGYEAASRPVGPPQIIYNLTFETMWWYIDPLTKAVDLTTDIDRNIGVLQSFYAEHELYKRFDYVHPNLGAMICRFDKPLEIPAGTTKNSGRVENISISLRRLVP